MSEYAELIFSFLVFYSICSVSLMLKKINADGHLIVIIHTVSNNKQG